MRECHKCGRPHAWKHAWCRECQRAYRAANNKPSPLERERRQKKRQDASKYGAMFWVKNREHCLHGHPWGDAAPENTRYHKSGGRTYRLCVTCYNQKSAAYAERLKAAGMTRQTKFHETCKKCGGPNGRRHSWCATCLRTYTRVEHKSGWTMRTHCGKGHLLDEQNTYWEPSTGHRRCRICETTNVKRRRHERRLIRLLGLAVAAGLHPTRQELEAAMGFYLRDRDALSWLSRHQSSEAPREPHSSNPDVANDQTPADGSQGAA